MDLISISLAGVVLLYLLLILVFMAGLGRLSAGKVKTKSYAGRVSVVIPFRNEKEHLLALLESLLEQITDLDNVEVILSDDHSSDGSGADAEDFCRGRKNFTCLPPAEGIRGKKKVLERAILLARGEWIIQLDADVAIGPSFLQAHLEKRAEADYALISAPVFVSPLTGFREYLEALEFMSLNASGAGSFGAGHAVMCNGANLAYSRQAWLGARDMMQEIHTPSGDDMFLLHALKKDRKNITFLADTRASARILPNSGWAGFFMQRSRWSSKTLYYTDSATLFTAFIVYFSSLLILLSLLLVLAGHSDPLVPLIAFLAKTLADFIFLRKYSHLTGQQKILKYFVPAALFHYFYIVVTPLLPLIFKVKWKGRSY